MSEETAATALAVLLEGLPARERERVAGNLVEALRQAYVSTHQKPPEWINKLLG